MAIMEVEIGQKHAPQRCRRMRFMSFTVPSCGCDAR